MGVDGVLKYFREGGRVGESEKTEVCKNEVLGLFCHGYLYVLSC